MVKNYFKCLWQRRLLILVFILLGLGIACMSVYSIYNPSHEVYNVTFKSDTNDYDLNNLNKTSYVKNVKKKIQTERINGEYIILNDYYFIESANLTASNYKDSKGYNHYKIVDQDNNVLYEDYGIYDRVEDGYILLDDYYYYTRGLYEISYKKGEVTLKDKDNKITTLKASWNKEYNYSYSSFSYIKSKKIAKSTKYNINEDGSITISAERRYFNSWQQARRFISRMAKDLSSGNVTYLRGDTYVKSDSKTKMNESIVSEAGGVKMLPFAFIGAASGFGVSLIVLLILLIVKKEEAIDNLEYDNKDIYKYPFHKSYWLQSFKELNDIKKVVVLAMLFAMMQVVRLIPLPSGFGNLGISLSAFFFAVIGLLYGPSVGFMIGAISDIFGYFVFPDGYPFHIGYTLQAALSGFTYGICFYKTKINYSKALFARLIINIFLNAVLGSICWADVADLSHSAARTYFLTLSLPKNIAYLIPQSVLIYLFIKALAPALKALGIMDSRIADDVTRLDVDLNM